MKGVLNLLDCEAAVGVLGEADGVDVVVADPEASSTSAKGHVSVSDDEDELK